MTMLYRPNKFTSRLKNASHETVNSTFDTQSNENNSILSYTLLKPSHFRIHIFFKNRLKN
jgi:hypothetical protein